MYTQRSTFFPGISKPNEVRPLVEQRVRSLQAHGIRTNLASSMYGVDAPAFSVVSQFESLAALQSFREKLPPDPTVAGRLALITRQPVRVELLEILLPRQPVTTPVNYIQRVVTTPALGKGPELQAMLVAYVKARQAAGVLLNLAVQVAGHAAGTLLRTLTFESLAELEELRARDRDDKSLQDSRARVAALSLVPNSIEIAQVLIPFPAA